LRKVIQGTCYQFMITQKLVFLAGVVDLLISTGNSGFLFNLHKQVCKCSMFANRPEFCKPEIESLKVKTRRFQKVKTSLAYVH